MLRKAKKHADNDYEGGIAKIKSLLQGFIAKIYCNSLLLPVEYIFRKFHLFATAEWYLTIKHNREQKDLHKIKGFTM